MTREVTAPAREGLPAGMVPWNGGNAAPADWDGGPVLFRSGARIDNAAASSWTHPWDGGEYPESPYDIIAYTPRATPPEPSSEVVGEAVEAGRIVLEGRGNGTYAEAESAIRLLINDIQALASRQPTPAPAADAEVRDGWKLVPVKLTDAMLDATCDTAADDERMRNTWAALLDASPKAPAVAIGDRDPDGWLAVRVNSEGGIVMPYGPLHPHPDRPNDPRYQWAPFYLGEPR